MTAPVASSNATYTFLQALYPGKVYPSGLTLNIRALLPASERGRVINDFYGSSAELLADGPQLKKWQAEGRSIYFGVALRRGMDGRAEACAVLPGLWADLDCKAVVGGPLTQESIERGVAILRERLASVFPAEHQPTLLVHTGGGLQAFWLFKEPLRLDAAQVPHVESILRGLHERMGCLPERQDVASIMRLPGFTNPKYAWQPVAQLVSMTDQRYALEDLAVYQSVSEPVEPTRERDECDTDLDLVSVFKQRGLYKGPGKNGRHRVTCPWQSSHTTEDGPSSTVIMAPDAGHPWWGYSCNHGHCAGRSVRDVLALFWDTPEDREQDPVATPQPIAGGSAPSPTVTKPTADTDHPTFPVDVFPDWMRAHTEQAAEELRVPVDMQAMCDLSAVSIATFQKSKIQISTTWETGLNLYTGVFNASGAGKSPSLKEATLGVRRAIEKGRRALQKREGDNAFELDLLKSQYDAMKAKAIEENKVDETKEQLREIHGNIRKLANKRVPEFLANDITPEGLASALGKNYGRIAVVSDEGSEVFEMAGGRYTGNGRAAIEIYLKGWDGGAIDRERSDGTRGVHISDPYISILVSTHFSTLKKLGGDVNLQGRGFMGRWLFSLPESIVGHRKPDPEEMDVIDRETYHGNLISLLKYKGANFTLSPEARAEWSKSRQWVEDLLAQIPDETDAGMLEREWLNKAATYTARIAGLLHMADHATESDDLHIPQEIPVECVQRARRLVEGYFHPHFKLAMVLMGLGQGEHAARQDYNQLTRAKVKVAKPRDLARGMWRQYSTDQIEDRLLALVDAGLAKPIEVRTANGRTQTEYHLKAGS